MAAPQRKLHLTNSKGRNATVLFGTLKSAPGPKLGLPGHDIHFVRFVACSQAGSHAQMVASQGETYGETLVDGDPEVDMEQVGRRIVQTSQVFLSSAGDVLHAPPKIIEVIYTPDGKEKERRDPDDQEGNVNDEMPVRWTGRRMKKIDAIRKFVFSRTIALSHQDGLTYDYLHGMASELAEDGELVMLGGGKKGKEPLRFQTNGTPYRGFLEGRVDGPKYQLLLHLSNMELKMPDDGSRK